MLNKVEHIGIAVKDLDQAIKVWEKLLGIPCYKTEEVASEKVKTAFFQLENLKIELLSSGEAESAITKFIEKRGEGIHHLAFHAESIAAQSQRVEKLGFTLINEAPKEGADQKLINFIHPAGVGKVLVELCQENPENFHLPDEEQ